MNDVNVLIHTCTMHNVLVEGGKRVRRGWEEGGKRVRRGWGEGGKRKGEGMHVLTLASQHFPVVFS